MKTLTLSTLLLVLAIATSSFVLSRNHVAKETKTQSPNVNTLRAHRQGKIVALTWTVSGGNAAEFDIERSDDGGEFYNCVGKVECTGASTYKFKDESAFPGIIHYRIHTYNTDGTDDISGTEVVKLVQRK